MDLSRPLTDRQEICTQVWCGVKPENLRAKFFTPPLKIWRGRPPDIAELHQTRRQSEARNFETAQRIDKCTKTVSNAGHHPTGF